MRISNLNKREKVEKNVFTLERILYSQGYLHTFLHKSDKNSCNTESFASN